jgi:hypothetical protein
MSIIIKGRTTLGYSGGVVKDGLQFYVDPANPASWDPANPSNPMANGATVNDLSGNGNHLTLQTVNSQDPTFTNGGLGSYWEIFQNGYFSSSNSFFNELSYTICIFCNSSSGGSFNWLVSSNNTLIRADINISAHFVTGTDIYPASGLPKNTWKFICQTYSLTGGNQFAETYYNGELIYTNTGIYGVPVIGNSPILIGANPAAGPQQYFTVCSFGPIMIYNRPLTGTEILKNYNHFRIRYRFNR